MDAQRDPQAWPSFTRMDPQQGARPFEWEQLTSAQKQAACRLFGLLRGMLEAPYAPSDEGDRRAGFMPVVRESHANNVILIDGKRGSGKTSLMSTVVREMRQPFEGGRRGRLDFDQAGRLLPVTFLAMYPLPPSANLLLYLVGALEEVVCELESRPADGWRGPDAPPWTAATNQTLLSRDRWMDLYRAAANAWDGNLERRAPNIDPEFYALELGQAERDRRHLSSIFRRFVDALCQDVGEAVHRRSGIWRQVDAGKGAEYRPFFVIVVDDADLAPERSVDLLGLLHKLNHPRVAFLLTGDSNLFLDLLRNHFLGMLLRPLADLNLTTEGWQFQEEAARAVALAGATLERIVPPAHRCHIDELRARERLAQLERALRALTMPHANCWPENLYDYFEFERYASLALPGEIRTLNALQRTLTDLTGHDSGRPAAAGQSPHAASIARFVTDLWSDLIEREPYIGRYRDEMRSVVRMTEKQELVVDCGSLKSKMTARRMRVVPNGAWALDVMANHTVVVSHPESGMVLSDPLKGVFKVAVDLVADFEAFQFAQGSPTPDGFQIEMMVVRWNRMQELGMKRGFTWPLPDWEEVLSFSLLAAAWKERVAMKVWNTANLDALARAFLALVLQVAAELRSVAHTLAGAPGGQGAAGDGEASWDALARKVVACLPGSEATERDHRTADWVLGRAGLLAAPEAGLPQEAAGEWLRALQAAFDSSGRWREAQAAMCGQRREQIRRRWEAAAPVAELEIDGILQAIDAASPGHPWLAAVRIEKIDPPPPAAARRAKRAVRAGAG
jgi:hypothetical protein